MIDFVKVFVSILAWLSFFVVMWGILLGRLSGWAPFSAALFFLFIGALSFIPKQEKSEDDGSPLS